MVEKRKLFRSPSNQMKSIESSLDSVKLSPINIVAKKLEPSGNKIHFPQIISRKPGF